MSGNLNWKLSSTRGSCQRCIHTCSSEIQIFFPGFLHTLKIILFSPDFWGMDAPRFFGFVLSLSTLHFMANSILRPQREMHCLFQYCRIASLYILLFYNSHTRFIRTGFHTKHKNGRSTLFLPLFLYHCTQHVLLLANCHTNPSAGARGFFLQSSHKTEIKDSA